MTWLTKQTPGTAFKTPSIASLIVTACTLVMTGATSSSDAASVTFSISTLHDGSSPATVQFKLDDAVSGQPGKVVLNAAVLSPTHNDTDLLSVFFDLADATLLSKMQVNALNTSSTVYTSEFLNDSVSLDNASSINPLKFDVGVQVGENGSAGGFVKNVDLVFSRTDSVTLTIDPFLNQRFGARLQGTGNNARGSSKITGFSPPPGNGDEFLIPTPSAAISGLLLIGSMLLRRRV